MFWMIFLLIVEDFTQFSICTDFVSVPDTEEVKSLILIKGLGDGFEATYIY